MKEVTFKDNYYLVGGGGDFIMDLPLFLVYYGVFMVWGGGESNIRRLPVNFLTIGPHEFLFWICLWYIHTFIYSMNN